MAEVQPTSTANSQPIAPKLMTICFLVENGQVLLGFKKRGFGANRWNGFGGKVQSDESIEICAVREMKEEAGVDIDQKSLENRGKITFSVVNKAQAFEIHLFVAKSHVGEPVESEEMRPMWFSINEIPYAEMWVGDSYWMQQLLDGKSVDGSFLSEDDDTIVEKKLRFY